MELGWGVKKKKIIQKLVRNGEPQENAKNKILIHQCKEEAKDSRRGEKAK